MPGYQFGVDLACIGRNQLPEDALARANEGLVTGLALVNVEILQHRQLPPLYRSGVRYKEEKRGETWRDACSTYAARFGNCKEFVAWRLAELWLAGYEAQPHTIVQYPRNGILFHVQLIYPDGMIEDPSELLGMKV